ncbi:hypothetical protein GGI25_001022 [Coemansia spiralis]|uniref:Uncharacterized protein n=2 Tax=Coemansia TaxID=4863 RepID=A0A9W8GDQ5_9FUNG|nr:hypothetical protein BX070DRAFT_250389 [Coemansia spiralis]KAJ1990697.1 hypothetical protein EDC05_003893 [Coemansia umbellata]KAJ2621622.1 hypothetical protein GGI26_003956 [Coemansia sp. RSA 1358]KAJ2680131.1 hypothetical protein GGI25_001022 [Coemansia spiralis]
MDVDDNPTKDHIKRRITDGVVKKRKPIRPSTSRADIYVTRERRKFNGHLQRARKLLVDRHYPHITIHGLGAAIQQAIQLANAIKASIGSNVVSMDVSTDTVTLYDDVVPQDNDSKIVTQARQNSAIHIKMTLVDSVRSKINAKK